MITYAAHTPQSYQYSFTGKTISLRISTLLILFYSYMVLPISIFFLTWIKLYFGVPLTIILGFGLYRLAKEIARTNHDVLTLPIRELIIILLLMIIWAFTISCFFYQTWDQHYRNALFRDLCSCPWPVYYPQTGNALVYYLMQWIVPAVFGKFFGFTVGNIALLFWNALGLYFVFLGICAFIRPTKTYQFWIIFAILFSWGGLHELGALLIEEMGRGSFTSLVAPYAWSGYYQYTPNEGLIAWVYNQTIAPWLATLILLINPCVRHYAFLGLCILPFAPLPFVGLVIFMLVDFLSGFLHTKFKDHLIECFSFENITASIAIFPIFLLYYKSNLSANHFGVYQVPGGITSQYLFILFIFYLLEFGIYALLIRKEYPHSLLLVASVVSLIIIPYFQIGYSGDFCMRASIPALFVLMLLVIRYLCQSNCTLTLTTVVLIICLTLSSLDSVKDTFLKIKAVRENNWRPVLADDIGTFADKHIGDVDWLQNFLVPDPQNTLFFKYFAQ